MIICLKICYATNNFIFLKIILWLIQEILMKGTPSKLTIEFILHHGAIIKLNKIFIVNQLNLKLKDSLYRNYLRKH